MSSDVSEPDRAANGLTDGWRMVCLGDFCRIDIGGTPPRHKPEYWAVEDGGHAWVSISDLRQPVVLKTKERITDAGVANSNVKLVKAGTIMMSFKLTIGRVAVAGTDLFTNEAIAAFQPVHGLDAAFLPYWLEHFVQDAETDQAIKGVTLNKQKLAALSGLLPPLEQQLRIAEVLRSVDEAIAAAQGVAEQELALWHGLTESLIWQPETDRPAAIRPLGDAVQSSDYGVNAPLGIEPAGYVVLRMGNLQDGWIDRTDLKWGEIADSEARALALEVGDILFNRTNSRDLVGKVALVREPTDDIYASYIVRLRVNRSVADPHYLFAVMHSRRAQAQFKSIATPGVSQSNINPTNLKKQLVPLPSLAEQREIASQLQAADEARRFAQQELTTLREIKANLMSDFLSGHVRVPA